MIPSASAPMLATRPPSLLGSPRPSSKNGKRTDFFDFPLEQPAAGSRLHSRRSSKHSELSAISQPPDRLGSTGVHAYSAPASTLKSTGVSFGTAKRNSLFAGNGPPDGARRLLRHRASPTDVKVALLSRKVALLSLGFSPREDA